MGPGPSSRFKTRIGDIAFVSGGIKKDEELALKRAAQEYPLELVFEETDGPYERTLRGIPITIGDANGKVVFESASHGPIFLLKLPKDRYTVTTRWDSWEFSAPITIGADRKRVVFSWRRATILG